jgi:hypothetical protein
VENVAAVTARVEVVPEAALLLSLLEQLAPSTAQANMLSGRTSGRRIAIMREFLRYGRVSTH